MTATLSDALEQGASLTAFEQGAGLPLFIQPILQDLAKDSSAFLAWYRDNADTFDELLTGSGALVLRGFAVSDTEIFGALMDDYTSGAFGYTAGVSSRRQIAGRVYESTNVPKEDIITLHQEMAYLPTYPSRLAFYCHIAPVTGGETILADMRKVVSALLPGFVHTIEERGVLYRTNFRDRDCSSGLPYLDMVHRPWQDTFSTSDRDEAAGVSQAMGLNAEWLRDGSLSVSYRAPGLIPHPRTRETVWFNMISTYNLNAQSVGDRAKIYESYYGKDHPWPFEVAYGDGSPISDAHMASLYASLRASTVTFPWSSRDVLLIDNLLTAHGRNPFTGIRDVQVVLAGERSSPAPS